MNAISVGLIAGVLLAQPLQVRGKGGQVEIQCRGGSDAEIKALWERTVSVYLQDDIFSEKYAYDSSHALMLPMWYAFSGGSHEHSAMRREFHAAFSRFLCGGGTFDNSQVKAQFTYFAAKYVAFAAAAGEFEGIPRETLKWVESSLREHWTSTPIVHWTERDKLRGVKRSIEWKQSVPKPRRSYYTAIADEELFTLATGSEVVHARALAANAPNDGEFDDIVDVFLSVVRERGRTSDDGGWLFQPGAWQDHPDFKFAHHARVADSLEGAVTPGIASDSSHSHRMPLLLRSLRDGLHVRGRSADVSEIEGILRAFRLQFETRVLVPADRDFQAPRINNFMDGRNGVYRYGYDTVGRGRGYGPHELSGVLFVGWFAFCRSGLLADEYRKISYPLDDEIVNLFVGPGTSRERHFLMQYPNYFRNGFAELHATIAGYCADI